MRWEKGDKKGRIRGEGDRKEIQTGRGRRGGEEKNIYTVNRCFTLS